jgi:hypothetical protein
MAAPRAKQSSEKFARMMPVALVVVLLGYLLSAYMVVFLPKLGRLVGGGSLDVAPLEKSVQDERAYQERLRQQLSVFEGLNPTQRAKATSLVTVGPDVPGILVQIEEIARQSGIVPTSIDATAVDKAASGGRRMVRVSFNVSGGDYAAFKSLLANLERSERVFDVQSVVMNPLGATFTLTVNAYFLDSSAAAPASSL